MGRGSVAWMEGYRSLVKEQVEFIPLVDTADTSKVREAMDGADVVVGSWPDLADPDCDVRLVHSTGAGVDHFNPNHFPNRAYLCNVYEHDQAIAEYVFMTLLALRRNLFRHDSSLRRGDWLHGESGATPVPDIAGLTIGVIGFGHIGTALIEPVRAFRMKLMAIRSKRPKGQPPAGVEFIGGPEDLPRLLAESDVVLVAVPHTEQTRGLIGEREIEMMKPTSYLINVGRGPVVDEAALYNALKRGRITGAAIDVWYRYPKSGEICFPSDLPLHELPNLIMTPHQAGSSEQTYARRRALIAANIDRIARRERPVNVVWEPKQG